MTFLAPAVFVLFARRVQYELDTKKVAQCSGVEDTSSGGRGSFINDGVGVYLERDRALY